MGAAVERYRLPDRPGVDAPALALAGTDGPDFPRESARSVHETLSDSRLVEFDGVGHSGSGETPARIAAEVDAFLHE